MMNYAQIQADLGFTDQDKSTWIENNARYYDDAEKGWNDKLMMHAYQSPATGRWIETPRQRREDFKASGTREWEGMANEKAETSRQKAYSEAASDAALDHTVRKAWQNLPEEKKQAALSA